MPTVFVCQRLLPSLPTKVLRVEQASLLDGREISILVIGGVGVSTMEDERASPQRAAAALFWSMQNDSKATKAAEAIYKTMISALSRGSFKQPFSSTCCSTFENNSSRRRPFSCCLR